MSIRPDPSDFEKAAPVAPYRTIRILLPGKPFGKQRPRFSRATGHAYTPEKTVSFERQVGMIAAQHFNAPLEGPIRLTINASFKPPKSWSKRKVADHLGRPHVSKPDGDNLAKAVSDSLNRIAYADDSAIFAQTITKFWKEEEGTEIIIEAFTPEAFA